MKDFFFYFFGLMCFTAHQRHSGAESKWSLLVRPLNSDPHLVEEKSSRNEKIKSNCFVVKVMPVVARSNTADASVDTLQPLGFNEDLAALTGLHAAVDVK